VTSHDGTSPTITSELLHSARTGNKESLDALFTIAYQELRRIAHRVRAGHDATLSTTALVHEAYLKLMPARVSPNDAAHFKRLIARAMREVLIDAARRSSARKRGGGDLAVTLDDEVQSVELKSAELLELEEALAMLERVDKRRAAVVECRFFGGLDVDETAAALEMSTATVKRDWRIARAWLAQAMGSGGTPQVD
jgi:RNA polymerase sigma factor (TIGR02999 family)